MSQSWQKISALCRILSSMSLGKCRTLTKAFIESQFSYCLLIWMLRSRTLNNQISHIYERALMTAYSDYNWFFYELLDKNDSFTIHQKNFQSLAVEIYKYLHGLYPAILSEVFKVSETWFICQKSKYSIYFSCLQKFAISYHNI